MKRMYFLSVLVALLFGCQRPYGDESFIDITPTEITFDEVAVEGCVYNKRTGVYDTLCQKEVQPIVKVASNQGQYVFYEYKTIPLRPVRIYFSEKYRHTDYRVYSLNKITKIKNLSSGKNISKKSWLGRYWWLLIIILVGVSLFGGGVEEKNKKIRGH